jgi:hypothetical protein
LKSGASYTPSVQHKSGELKRPGNDEAVTELSELDAEGALAKERLLFLVLSFDEFGMERSGECLDEFCSSEQVCDALEVVGEDAESDFGAGAVETSE